MKFPAGKNLHIVMNDFTHDSRVLKETASIDGFGIFEEVHVAALWKKGLAEYEDLGGSRQVWRVILNTRILPRQAFFRIGKYLEWCLRVFLKYCRSELRVVHCHDLTALPIGLVLKASTGAMVVYDAHELETERDGHSDTTKKLAKVAEKLLIRYADYCIFVSDSIAKWYQESYMMENGLRFKVIKNVPKRPQSDNRPSAVLKEKFGVKAGELLFIYQGVLSTGNGVRILLDAFSKIKKDKHVAFMGYGPMVEEIKQYEKMNVNIHFQEAVPPEDLPYYTSSADIGIALIENTCLSYYYCLPNKCYEYLMSGLPIIVSNFPDMQALVRGYDCGWDVEPNEEALLKLISQFSEREISAKRSNAESCRNTVGWEVEETKLRELYFGLGQDQLVAEVE